MMRQNPKVSTLLSLLCLSLLIGCGAPSENAASSDPSAANGQGDASSDGSPVVNVYSSRHYDVDDEVYESFTRETGIKVNLIESDSAALLERIKREGDQSPADVFVTVDAGRLYQAQQEGIFDPVTSEILTERIPANLRHPEGLWFGLTKRARVIMIAKDRVESGAITRYEDLANPKWQGKVLIRSSSNIYNQSLMGSIIAAAEEKGAEAWCRGLVANMARPPQGGDRDQIRAVAAGEGDIAVANTYYLAAMMVGSPEDQAAAAKVQPIFPNQDNRGAHVNISGAGVVKGAPNRANAIRFLEHLTSEQAQEKFAGANKEYPVVAGVALAPELEGFGEFREDDLNASVFGASNQQALMLMDRCGWR